jgi:hypothetical protein
MADLRNCVTNIRDVYRGPGATLMILSAFLRARECFDVNISYGVATERPGELLVLVVVDDTKAMFTPSDLRKFGDMIVKCLPLALAYGAPPSAVDELRDFAAILIQSTDDAATISPHGLH